MSSGTTVAAPDGTEVVLGEIGTRVLLKNSRVRVWEVSLAPVQEIRADIGLFLDRIIAAKRCQRPAFTRRICPGVSNELREPDGVTAAAGVFRELWVRGLLVYEERKGIQWDWQALAGAMTKAPLGGEKN